MKEYRSMAEALAQNNRMSETESQSFHERLQEVSGHIQSLINESRSQMSLSFLVSFPVVLINRGMRIVSQGFAAVAEGLHDRALQAMNQVDAYVEQLSQEVRSKMFHVQQLVHSSRPESKDRFHLPLLNLGRLWNRFRSNKRLRKAHAVLRRMHGHLKEAGHIAHEHTLQKVPNRFQVTPKRVLHGTRTYIRQIPDRARKAWKWVVDKKNRAVQLGSGLLSRSSESEPVPAPATT